LFYSKAFIYGPFSDVALDSNCSKTVVATHLFAVQNPRALWHETVLARDPFLDLLVGGALTGWLLIAEMARRALTSSIVIPGALGFSPALTECTNSSAIGSATKASTGSLWRVSEIWRQQDSTSSTWMEP